MSVKGTKAVAFLAKGRDTKCNQSLAQVLELCGLFVEDWDNVALATGSTSCLNREIVDGFLNTADVYVVLLTPDAKAVINDWIEDKDGCETCNVPRPNVLAEMGMCLQHAPKRTILVRVGDPSIPSNYSGTDYVDAGKPGWANKLYNKLVLGVRFNGKNISSPKRVLDDLRVFPPLEPGLGAVAAEPQTTIEEPRGQAGQSRADQLHDILINGYTADQMIDSAQVAWRSIKDQAESEDRANPIADGAKVGVQLHYESPFNGAVGDIFARDITISGDPCYWVRFPAESELGKHAFHPMYLTRI